MKKTTSSRRVKRAKWSMLLVGTLALGAPVMNGCTQEQLPQPGQAETGAQESTLQTAPCIAGEWKSAGTEAAGPGLYGFRRYSIGQNTWSLAWSFFGDSTRRVPLFRVEVAGTYTVGRASASVAGAHEGVFRIQQKTLTALTSNQAVLASLGFGGCNLVPRRAMSLYASGCGSLSSVVDCPQEFDIVKLSPNKAILAAGRRPADGSGLCTPAQRPTALGYRLVRIAASATEPALE